LKKENRPMSRLEIAEAIGISTASARDYTTRMESQGRIVILNRGTTRTKVVLAEESK